MKKQVVAPVAACLREDPKRLDGDETEMLIEQLRTALQGKHMPLPWRADPEYLFSGNAEAPRCAADMVGHIADQADLRLVLAAVNAAPALLARIRELETKLALSTERSLAAIERAVAQASALT